VKYHVGDKVKIKEDLTYGNTYTKFVNNDMAAKAGKIVTIKYVYNSDYQIEEDMWFWTDDMFEGLEESTPIKAYDLMKLAAENPQAYEGKQYKAIDGGSIIDLNGISYKELYVKNGKLVVDTDGFYHARISSCLVIQRILPEPKQVSALEAIKAHKNGEKVYCMFNGCKKRIGDMYASNVILVDWITCGQWYIEKEIGGQEDEL